MFRISCFADEISSELEEQVRVMQDGRVHYAELRSMWNRNVLDLTDDELDRIKERFAQSGIRISCIGSPIGKTDIRADFSAQLKQLHRAVEVALHMGCRFIRIFSFYMGGDELDQNRDAVIGRLGRMLRQAEKYGLVLLHENEAGIYGQRSERCLDLIESLPDSCFGAVFDPSNFVAAGEEPLESFGRLGSHIRYVHIKDIRRDTGVHVIAGRGDGRIKEILGALRDREGLFLSLEPHLSRADKFTGFTGPELFREDLEALRDILRELGIGFE